MNRRVFLQSTVAGSLLTQLASASNSEIPSDEIWDLHAHLSNVPGTTPEERIDQLLVYADRMNVSRLVVFMGWPFVSNPAPDELCHQNDQVLAALAHRPDRVLGFAYVSGEHPDESLKEIERCVAQGPMVGIKLWTARRCSEAALDPLIRRCTELKAVVYQHTWIKSSGNLEGESTPADVALLARRHPDARIICGHTGGNWEIGIRAIRENPNVWIDLGGSEPTAGFVEMAIRELGADRILYGSDVGGRSFASQLAKVYGAETTLENRRKILGGNLKQLLKPIMDLRGLR